MKGFSFQNGVEFKINIEGESWPQGSVVSGKLETRAQKARVILAQGSEKKVKAKSPDAFKILEETTDSEWKFQLTQDAPITDATSSLYLLYGSGEALETLGQLRLNVLPHHHIKDLMDTFVTQFRFALKKVSSGKNGYVEIKLDPPTIKDWASLEQVLICAKLKLESLEAIFIFTRKQIDAAGGALSAKTIKIEVERDWPFSSIIHHFNQRLNIDKMQKELEKVVEEYRS